MSPTEHGLPAAVVQRIHATLADVPEVEQATLYGSRALGRFRPGSDIDLTLSGADLTPRHLARLDTALDDLLLPWRFDLSLHASLTSPALLEHIERVGKVFYQRPTAAPVDAPCPSGAAQARD